VTILLFRHTHAGDRDHWVGDDRQRPLSGRGVRQAAAVVDQLAGYPVERVLSSPYLRCVQSVQPLASVRGLDVEEEHRLAEGTAFDLVRGLLRQVDGEHVVLCSHGDVIGAIVTDLAHRGVDLGEPGPVWQKGSTWVLDGAPDAPAARYLPPPA
jgi:phosphohistidine phosphatase SixA